MKYFIHLYTTFKSELGYTTFFEDLYQREDINTIVFFKNCELNNTEYCTFIKYNSYEDIFNKLNKINNEDIICINTFDEKLIEIKSKLQCELGFAYTENFEIFRNKDLQRKILSQNYPTATVSFQVLDLNSDVKPIIDYPCIIKPTSGVQSSGVALLKSYDDFVEYKDYQIKLSNNLKSRGYEITEYLIEEYVDGEMYSVDYFVNSKGEIYFSPAVKEIPSKELGIDDFSNYVRLSYEYFKSELSNEKIQKFIEKHVKVFQIRNTFIHHEFKLNSKGILKTIELNGRIGGYRLELNKEVYDYNILDMVFSIHHEFKTTYFYAAFAIYSEFEGIYGGYNKDLIKIFRELPSVYKINTKEQDIGKLIGPAKKGYANTFTIKIKNISLEQFKIDYEIIRENYKKIIITEEI